MPGRRARRSQALADFRSSLLKTAPPPPPLPPSNSICNSEAIGPLLLTFEKLLVPTYYCWKRQHQYKRPTFVASIPQQLAFHSALKRFDIKTIIAGETIRKTISGYEKCPTNTSSIDTRNQQDHQKQFIWEDFLTALYQRTFSRVDYVSLGQEDEVENKDQKALYTFGEILPLGVDGLLSNDAILSKHDGKHKHKDQKTRIRFYDLGAGLGRLALQVWLAYSEIDDVIAIEYAPSRFQVGLRALERLVQMNEKAIAVVDRSDRSIILSMHTSYAQFIWPDEKKQEWPALIQPPPKWITTRTLTYMQGDLFTYCEQVISRANIVFIETDIPDSRVPELWQLLCNLHQGTRFLLYHTMDNLKARARMDSIPFLLFRKIGTFSTPTTWSRIGAPFEVWEKL